MSHEYHIVTPYSRPENFDFLVENLKPHRITWHIILSDTDPFVPKLPEWVKIYRCTVPPDVDPCYWKLNWFIQRGQHIPDDFYLMQFCDDDALPPEFSNRLRDAEIPQYGYVVAGDNGQVVPPTGLRHPARRYDALPERMQLHHAGSCRPCVRGKHLHTLIYPNNPGADQIALISFVHRFSRLRGNLSYVNKTAIMFNYLEPGRWTKRLPEVKK